MAFRVLLATDGSIDAFKAARRAAGLCAALKDPLVTILFIKDFGTAAISPIGSLTGLGRSNVRSGLLDGLEVEDSVHREAAEAFEETRKAFDEAGVPVTQRIEIGDAAEVICQVGERGGFNLIVVGSRGLGDIGSLVLGSVSNRVVHRSKVPVLVVR